MKSSYFNNDINYGDIITSALFNKNPKTIVEFGILDGFSLKVFAELFPNAKIKAFDIFDEFNGNGAKKEIVEKFKNFENVSIEYGDFYKKYNDFTEIDILHIDIANNGDVYDFAINNYLPLLSKDGILIFEGGSQERDNVEWMIKYNKPKINPVIHHFQKRLDYKVVVIGKVPSITIISKNHNFNIHELCLEDFDKGVFELVNHFTRNLKDESFDLAKNNIHLFNNDSVKTLVAEYNGKIIGTAKIFMEIKLHNNLKKIGHIEDLVVEEKYRKNGVGREILKRLIKIAKENDCYKIALGCTSLTTPFYEKSGFVNRGAEMNLYL